MTTSHLAAPRRNPTVSPAATQDTPPLNLLESSPTLGCEEARRRLKNMRTSRRPDARAIFFILAGNFGLLREVETGALDERRALAELRPRALSTEQKRGVDGCWVQAYDRAHTQDRTPAAMFAAFRHAMNTR